MRIAATRRIALAIAFAAALVGCAITPPSSTPGADAAVNRPAAQADFIGSSGADVVPEPVSGAWWRLYDSPVLERLVQDALAANTDLQVAAANIARARAAFELADAAREPSTSINTSTALGRRSAQEELHPGQPFPSKFVYSTGFSVAYQVDLFGQIELGIDAARADLGAATAARDAARVTVVAETTRAFLESCSAAREIAVAQSLVALQAESSELTRRLADQGRGSPVDVDRSRAQEQQLRASIPQLQAQRRVALLRLAALTGRAPRELPQEPADCEYEPQLTRPIAVGDGASLLRRRPDIRRAEFELSASAQRVGVAMGDLYPKIALGASIGSVGATQNAFRDDSFRFSLGPLLSWEFPDRSRAQARIRAAGADREAALARLDGVVLTALKETESALEVQARDRERLELLQSARDRARQAAQDTQRLFEAGRIGYLPVLDALRTQSQVELNLASAQSRLASDQVNLFLALGGGWQEAGGAVH